jgi:hypothetical protein
MDTHIVIKRISRKGLILRFKDPLSLKIRRDRDTGMYLIKNKKFGIFTYAERRRDLKKFVKDDIIYLWTCYVKKLPHKKLNMVDENVRTIRTNLLAAIDEVK